MNLKAYMLLPAFFGLLFPLLGQNFKTPSDYLSFIKAHQQDVASDVIAFAQEIENSPKARTMEGKRRAIATKVKSMSAQLKTMPDFKSNRVLLDSLCRYALVLQKIMDEDYLHVVRLQDSVTRSALAEKRFAMAKQLALSQLVANEGRFLEGLQNFGRDYAFPVPKKYSDEYEKLLAIQQVAKQHNVYRYVYVKCSSQEALLAKAIEYRKKAEMEQYSLVLAKYVKEGYKVLDTVKANYVDKDIARSTKDLLRFYEEECEYKIPMLISFMSRGGEDQRKGKTDIGNNININPHVNIEPHADIATYSNTKGDLDEQRPVLIGNWNKASQSFLKKYFPPF